MNEMLITKRIFKSPKSDERMNAKKNDKFILHSGSSSSSPYAGNRNKNE